MLLLCIVHKNASTFRLEIPRVSNEEQATFEHELTVQEIKNVLHSFEKNKTPGEDGFSKKIL